MRYMLLICTDEQVEAAMPEAERAASYAAYFAFTQATQQQGAFVAGEALQPVHTATTVRLNNGKLLTTDGPMAETKEQIGGFYVLDCKNLDEAIAWAAKIPGAQHGSIEIRPIWDYNAQ